MWHELKHMKNHQAVITQAAEFSFIILNHNVPSENDWANVIFLQHLPPVIKAQLLFHIKSSTAAPESQVLRQTSTAAFSKALLILFPHSDISK